MGKASLTKGKISTITFTLPEQFEGISTMLGELSQDFSCSQQFDVTASETAVAALKNIGIHTLECAAKIDKFARMSLEIKIKLHDDVVLNPPLRRLPALQRYLPKPCG